MNASPREKLHQLYQKLALATTGFLTLAAVAAIPEGVIYQTDFATAESNPATPEFGRWYTAQPYATKDCYLCRRPSDFTTWRSAYVAEDEIEPTRSGDSLYSHDGWCEPNFNDYYKMTPAYRYSLDGVNNGCFYYYYGSTSMRFGHVVTPFMNEISTGVLRMTADMRAPKSWNTKASYIMVAPIYKSQLGSMNWKGGGIVSNKQATPYDSVGQFGLAVNQTLANTILGLHKGDSAFVATNLHESSKIPLHWIRFVVDYDLNNQKMSGAAYDLGTGRPELAMELPTSPLVTFADIDFYTKDKVTAANPLAGIDLSGYYGANSQKTTADKVFIDNLKCEWKRPGGTEFESFYENDFGTRRYRVLSGPQTTMTAFTGETVTSVVTNRFHGYPMTSDNDWTDWVIVPNLVRGSSAVQPLGVDGWRRLSMCPNYSTGYVLVNTFYNVGDENPKLCGSGNNQCASIMNTFGRKITSGKVRFRASARTKNIDFGSFNVAELCKICVVLGNEALYTAAETNWGSRYGAMAGIQYTAEKGSTNLYSFVEADTGRITDTGIKLAVQTWYQMDLTADLDTQTYDCAIYQISTNNAYNADTAPTGAAIFRRTGVKFKNAVTDISTFILFGFGNGSDRKKTDRYTWWDNVQVDAISSDGVTTNFVYSNDFKTRLTVPSDTPQTVTHNRLVEQFDRDDGPDHWWWVNWHDRYTPDPVILNCGGKPCLRIGGDNTFENFVVRPLGQTLTQGVYELNAVARPPAHFMRQSSAAWITFGDEVFMQGRRSADTAKSAKGHWLGTVGFYGNQGPVGGTTNSLVYVKGASYGVTPSTGKSETLTTPTKLDTAHWYRINTKVDMDQKRFRARIYDLGSTRGTSAHSGGTLVADFGWRNFLVEPQGGLAGIGFFGLGMGAQDGGDDDPYAMLVDRVELRSATGLLMYLK